MRHDSRAVAPIIAEILLVAMSVALAASLFYMANSLSTQSISDRPMATFAPVSLRDGNATIIVAGVTRAASTSSYALNLVVDGTGGRPDAMPTNDHAAAFSIGGEAYTVTWKDVSGNGMLNAGDTFVISGVGMPLPQHHSFRFILLWSDGTAVQSAAWST